MNESQYEITIKQSPHFQTSINKTKRFYEFALKNPLEIAFATLENLAEELEMNAGHVSRCAKKLTGGFTALRELAKDHIEAQHEAHHRFIQVAKKKLPPQTYAEIMITAQAQN